MQCERLIKLAKQWYLHVKEETMAPARMVQFIKQHVAFCPVCSEDPAIESEIDRITEIVLPESKIPKAVRLKQEAEDAEKEEDEEESGDSDDDTDDDNDDDDDDAEDSEENGDEDDVDPLAEDDD